MLICLMFICRTKQVIVIKVMRAKDKGGKIGSNKYKWIKSVVSGDKALHLLV